MKKIITILLILSAGFVKAQTIIPGTTTVDSLHNLPKGQYRFFSGPKKDTVDMSKDTIPKCPVCPSCPPPVICPPPIVCPICPICPIVDTAAIQALKVCPPQLPQRTMISLSYNPATNQWITLYNDSSTSIFIPTKILLIQ